MLRENKYDCIAIFRITIFVVYGILFFTLGILWDKYQSGSFNTKEKQQYLSTVAKHELLKEILRDHSACVVNKSFKNNVIEYSVNCIDKKQ